MASEGAATRQAMAPSSSLPRISVVVFSKDRPYQLLSCIASLLRCNRGAFLDVSVLYKASNHSFAESYSVIRNLFKSTDLQREPSVVDHCIHWEREGDEQSEPCGTGGSRRLGDLLDAVLSRCEANGIDALMFTVDDSLWYDSFDTDAAIELLRADASVYSVHAKLCPRVEYAHPNNKFMRLPRFSSVDGRRQPQLLYFERAQGEYDWNYPWELSASVYRVCDVREMLSLIRQHFGNEGVDHPNRLEGYGVRLIKQEKVPSASRAPRCACLTDPVVSIITINRVQSLFDNPTYGRGGCNEAAPEESPEQLDNRLRAAFRKAMSLSSVNAFAQRSGLTSQQLMEYCSMTASDPEAEGGEDPSGAGEISDALLSFPPKPILGPPDRYRSAYLDSVHVPLIDPWPTIPPQMPDAPPAVSWLMPVCDTPKQWLEDAVASIVGQAGMGPGSWELIAVDDQSTSPETLEILARWEGLPQMRVIRNQDRLGVGGALNSGWMHCRGDFVARLDADDVAHRERLQRQLAYMSRYPSLGLLGGAFRTFREVAELETPEALARTRLYRMPCHPVIARWRMLFGCSLAHPTVTMRREIVEQHVVKAGPLERRGPYPEDEEAEDHCCWLELPLQVQFGNTADVVCYLRRHTGSRSASAAAAIKRSSYGAVRRFVLQCRCTEAPESSTPAKLASGSVPAMSVQHDDEFSTDDVALLWGGGSASSAEQAKRVSNALDVLESFFFRFVVAGLGKEGAETIGDVGSDHLPVGFIDDFVIHRASALRDYITSSCSKLRGLVAVQSLACGDLSSGAEMMKQWLNSGDAGLKSLGALIRSGYADSTQGQETDRPT